MTSVKFQVLGYRDFSRKADGKHMTILTACSQCTPADNARGIFGMKSTDFFLPDEFVGSLTPECVGQEFIPDYGLGAYGRPVLVSFKLQPMK